MGVEPGAETTSTVIARVLVPLIYTYETFEDNKTKVTALYCQRSRTTKYCGLVDP